MTTRKNPSDDLTEATEQAREVIRELHGLLKDVKQVRQDVKVYLTTGAAILVQLAIKVELEESLSAITRQYSQTLAESTVRHEQNWEHVLKQIREIVGILHKINPGPNSQAIGILVEDLCDEDD